MKPENLSALKKSLIRNLLASLKNYVNLVLKVNDGDGYYDEIKEVVSALLTDLVGTNVTLWLEIFCADRSEEWTLSIKNFFHFMKNKNPVGDKTDELLSMCTA